MSDAKKGEPVQDEDQVRLPRVTLDLKVPIWSVGIALAGLVWSLVSMYFQLSTMSAQMADLQLLLKASNTQTVQLAAEQALLKYRIEKLENAQGVNR